MKIFKRIRECFIKNEAEQVLLLGICLFTYYLFSFESYHFAGRSRGGAGAYPTHNDFYF